MLQSIPLIEEILGYVQLTLRGDAPLLVYFVLAFIPLCILVAIRETFCWFFKISKISRKVDKLDKRLMVLNGSVEEIVRIMKYEIQKNKVHAGKASAHSGIQKDSTPDMSKQKSNTVYDYETETPQEITLSEKDSETASSNFTLEERPWSEK